MIICLRQPHSLFHARYSACFSLPPSLPFLTMSSPPSAVTASMEHHHLHHLFNPPSSSSRSRSITGTTYHLSFYLHDFHRPAANSSTFRVAPMTVQSGDRILDYAVLVEVPAVGLTNPMVVVQVHMGMTIDGGRFCCGSAKKIAQGQEDYGPGITVMSMKLIDEINGGVLCCICTEEFAQEGQQDYGPRMIVTKNRAVAYTGLLHPKAMRKLEVWSIYRFICCCARCSDLHPFTYVNHALQEIDGVSCASSGTCSHYNFFVHMAVSKYLSVGDPESCEKLEKMPM